MEDNSAYKLEAIDLIRLYGVIQYQWNLQTDTLDWRGPINKLLSPDSPLVTGSSFHNILDSQNLWQRLQAVTQATIESPCFDVRYHLYLPTHNHCYVEEKGEILYDKDGLPLGIQGHLKFLEEEDDTQSAYSLSGYDALTGFSEKEVSLETLTSYLEQSQLSGIPGAYMAVTIDQLMLFACRYGFKSTELLIKETTEAIRQAIRFNDFMGKTSSCCFGIILKECDRWGIIRAADRLISSVQDISIRTEKGEKIKTSISLGGVVFPGDTPDAARIMQKAERYLFEAQSLKGGRVAGMPYNIRTAPELERPSDMTQKGKRRTRDMIKTAKAAQA